MKQKNILLFFISLWMTSPTEAQTSKINQIAPQINKENIENTGLNVVYGKYSKKDEIITKRSQNAKHFKNPNGSFTVQIGENYHYKDDNGKWQDIDLAIESGAIGKSNYFFKSEKNDVKSYFPKNPGSDGIKMILPNGLEFSWWENPQMKISSNNNSFAIKKASAVVGNSNNEKLTYSKVYNNISEEFVILNTGIENNTIIESLSNELKSLPSESNLEFSHFIAINPKYKIFDANEKLISNNSITNHFSIQIGHQDEKIYFGEIVVFDNAISKDQALLINMPSDKLTETQKKQLQESVLKIPYHINFVQGGIEVVTTISSSWLNAKNRNFPVTIDPTVTITPTNSSSNLYGPLTHWYGYQRSANLYLQSEIGIFGTITDIEYNSTTTGIAGSRPTKVYLRTTPNTTLSAGAWNSNTYTSGAQLCLNENTDQGNTTGWKNLTFTTPFNYTQDNLMIMVYDAWGGTGSAKYYNQSTSGTTGRQAAARADNTDPGESVNLVVENRLHQIRITYSDVLTVSDLNKNINIKIYPNPIKDFISINTDETVVGFEIYDLTGKKLNYSKTNFNNKIDVSKLSKGQYILKINTNKGQVQHKFIKN